jgi:hypothetical protein
MLSHNHNDPRPTFPKAWLSLGFLVGIGLIVLVSIGIWLGIRTRTNSDNPGETPPATVAPLAYAKSDANSIVRASLPEAIKTHPKLHNRLYKETEVVMQAFAKEAFGERAQNKAPQPPYRREQNWALSVESTRLISLYAFELRQTIEPQPKYGYQTLIWDKVKEEFISPSRLFNSKADTQFVQSYLCQQLDIKRAEKLETLKAICPNFLSSRFVLTPSSQVGKSAGISVIYAPGEIHPKDEEVYWIAIPLDLIAPLLQPPYHEDFGGLALMNPPPTLHNMQTEFSAAASSEVAPNEPVSNF